MICYQCKSEIPDGATTCKFCGKPAGANAVIQAIVYFALLGLLIWWGWRYFAP